MKTQLSLVLTALWIVLLAGIRTGHTANAQIIKVAPSLSTYLITVRTGCVSGSGTDANVTMQLRQTTPGGAKTTSMFLLDDPSINDFERGSTNSFMVVKNRLDRVDWVYLAHDNSGGGPGWMVREVLVHNYSTGLTAVFPVHRWLAKDECDGATSIVLKAGVRPTCTPYYYGLGAGC